jgi:hypothetical protein
LTTGTAPNGVANSFIFWHWTSTINSKWWFNGTQTATSSEISDERVKKEIEDIPEPLEKLMKLKPKQYMLCDEKDYLRKYGIIAQDVKEVIPELVYTDTEYIANIFSKAIFKKEKIDEIIIELGDDTISPPKKPKIKEIFNYTITTVKNIKGLVNIDDELKLLLDNIGIEDVEIIIEDSSYHNRYKKRYTKVKSIINDYTIEVYDDIELNDIEKENLFIYGKKINDFLKLDYSALYSLNIACSQELYKIIQNLEERIKVLENK